MLRTKAGQQTLLTKSFDAIPKLEFSHQVIRIHGANGNGNNLLKL